MPAAAVAVGNVVLGFFPPAPELIEEHALEQARSPIQGGEHFHVAKQTDEPDDHGAGRERKQQIW